MSTCEDRSKNDLEKWLEVKKMKFSTDKCKRAPVEKNQSSVFR